MENFERFTRDVVVDMRSTRVRIFVSAILMAFIGVGAVVADEENKETVLPLLAFVSMGCSMSTVVNMIANRLLAAHGYRMMPDYEKTGDKEVINMPACSSKVLSSPFIIERLSISSASIK